jgi:maltose O-acetyltransferase
MKALVKLAFRLVVALVYAAYRIEGVNALLLFMPAKLIVPTLRRYGATIGSDTEIIAPLIIHNAANDMPHYRNLIIGDHCYIARDVFFDLKREIVLEDYAIIGMRSTLLTHVDLGERPPDLMLIPPQAGAIRIKRGSYLAAGVIVTHGVTIGARCVVAAGAVVLRDVPDGARVGGIPAKELRPRAPDPEPTPENA